VRCGGARATTCCCTARRSLRTGAARRLALPGATARASWRRTTAPSPTTTARTCWLSPARAPPPLPMACCVQGRQGSMQGSVLSVPRKQGLAVACAHRRATCLSLLWGDDGGGGCQAWHAPLALHSSLPRRQRAFVATTEHERGQTDTGSSAPGRTPNGRFIGPSWGLTGCRGARRRRRGQPAVAPAGRRAVHGQPAQGRRAGADRQQRPV